MGMAWCSGLWRFEEGKTGDADFEEFDPGPEERPKARRNALLNEREFGDRTEMILGHYPLACNSEQKDMYMK
jgi:hypothetical protein